MLGAIEVDLFIYGNLNPYRRLERGKFQCPAEAGSIPVTSSHRELRWLLDGLSLKQPKAHSDIPIFR
jgi:hypothetical protein